MLTLAATIFCIFGYPIKWFNKIFETDWDAVKKLKKVPGYFPLPFIGTIWAFVYYGYKPETIQQYYKDMFAKFGSIFQEETLFNNRMVSVVNRVDIEKVFRATGKYPLRPPTEVVAYYRRTRPDRYITVGIVNEQGISIFYLDFINFINHGDVLFLQFTIPFFSYHLQFFIYLTCFR